MFGDLAARIEQAAAGDLGGGGIAGLEALAECLRRGNAAAQVPFDQSVPRQQAGFERGDDESDPPAGQDGGGQVAPHGFALGEAGGEQGIDAEHEVGRAWRRRAAQVDLREFQVWPSPIAPSCCGEHLCGVVTCLHLPEVFAEQREEGAGAAAEVGGAALWVAEFFD